MDKKKGILVIVVSILLLAVITYVDVFGIGADKAGSASDIKLGLDLAGGVSITYQVVGDGEPGAEDMADTIEKLKKRVEKYSTEALVYQEGTDRINIEIPGVMDAEQVLKELGQPGSLYFIPETAADGSVNYSWKPLEGENGKYTLDRSIEELMADGSIALFGTDVENAQAGSIKEATGQMKFIVELKMNQSGTEKFARLTERAARLGETIAIYYDGELVSVAGVEQALTTGEAQISGNFTYEEADKLATTIRIGGLKLELKELHSKVVGAQLGSEAISTSITAGAIGLVIVIIFMIAIYYISGLAAGIALCLYSALIVLLLNGFDITLTLPGMAGIILSIGMAVDANVIIFARIREELATGKTVKSAMKIGFDKAMGAILDGNITTLLAAGVLLLLGSGSIRGFGQTLALGIVLSMVTALGVTRLLMMAFYAVGIRNEKWYGVGKPAKKFDFLSKKGIFFGISVAVIVAGFIMMGVNTQLRSQEGTTGDILNFSLDFKGGTATTVAFNEQYDLSRLENEVVPKMEAVTGGSAVQTQTVQGSNEVVFKTNELNGEQRQALQDLFMKDYGVEQKNISTETISSTISNETRNETILAVVIAILCMLIYIRIRFKDIRFGASSVIALIHDVLVVLAFYAFAWVSVGNTFIACILTIVGYSINATIVIFDRIRENMAQTGKKTDLKEVVNASINQTLSRSLFTSLTTFIMVFALFIMGVTAIREFALPLMAGILCGTYSSICIAGALWYVLRKKFPPKEKKN